MRVLLNEDGYVKSYAIVGCDDWTEVEDPDNFDEDIFSLEYESYKVENGKLVKNIDKLADVVHERYIEELRVRRKMECFPIINRGALWYDRLTNEQRNELEIWYSAWLDVTDTMEIPDKPNWLE